jgi:succinoglycan biosynthesis transport protein ExoP
MDMSALVGAVVSRWRRIALVTLGLLVVTYVILMFMPRLYESSASILVEPRESAYTRATNDVLPQSNFADETAIASQIELVKSRGTLMQVIDTENLRALPEFNGGSGGLLDIVFSLFGGAGPEMDIDEIVLENVSDATTVVQERESRIITILFRSTDAQVAARVANAIANTHVQRRAGLYLSDTADATRWLETEIAKLRTKVTKAEDLVANYRVDNDLYVGANDISLLDQQLTDLSAQISSAQERENSARSRAALIRGLIKSGQSIDGVPDVRQSLVVQQLSEEKARLQGDRAQRSATLLPNHPTILALTAQIEEVDKQIQVEGRQVAEALEAEAKIEAGLEASLRDELTRLKIEASTATKGSVTLNELEREAKAQRDLLETYLLRYRDAASRTEANATLPDVRVVSFAAAPISPAYPQKGLILAAVAIVSIMLQLGQILFAELVAGRAFVDASGQSVQNRYQEPQVVSQAAMAPEPARQAAVPPNPFPAPSQRKRTEYRAATPSWQRPASSVGSDRRQPDAKFVFDQSLAQAAANLAAGQERLVIVTSLGRLADSRGATETLSADLIARGLSTVEIDAGSRITTPEVGLSDLCDGSADFGDVVHRGDRSDFALVPWGRSPAMLFQSRKCVTLVEALQDIFEVVVVDAGRAGSSSCLDIFSHSDATLLVVVAEGTEKALIEQERGDLHARGYNKIETAIVRADRSRAA